MKGIKCGFAHKAFSAIDKAEKGAYLDLDYRVVDFFKEKGLVSAYSTWFYQEMLSSAAKLERAKTRLKTIKREKADYERTIEGIEYRLKSTFGYSSREIREMKELLADKRQKRAERLGEAEKLEVRVDRLEAMPTPSDYRLTIDGNYVMLTEKGNVWLKCLSERLDEFSDAPLENFEKVLEDFESKIDRYCTRSVDILELMGSNGFGKHSREFIDCAVRLATTEVTIQKAYNRMKAINDYLYDDSPYHDGLKTYDRLIPAAAIAKQPENLGMLKEELIETYNALVKKRYYENFYTWWLASAVMELNRFEPKMNLQRYFEVRDALTMKGWDQTTRHTCYMAANLARGTDSSGELANQLKIQQQGLVNTGRSDSDDLATASLILLDSEASLEERTERFVEAWEEMEGYDWGRFYKFYPVAAALSVMPYSVAENVIWLDRIIKRLKEYGLEDNNETRDGLTYRALDILMAAYRGQFKQEVMPNFIVHSGDSFLSD